MNLTRILLCLIVSISILLVNVEAAPGKIPVKAIQKAGKAIGKGLRAINVASTVHDIANALKPKKKKKH